MTIQNTSQLEVCKKLNFEMKSEVPSTIAPHTLQKSTSSSMLVCIKATHVYIYFQNQNTKKLLLSGKESDLSS